MGCCPNWRSTGRSRRGTKFPSNVSLSAYRAAWEPIEALNGGRQTANGRERRYLGGCFLRTTLTNSNSSSYNSSDRGIELNASGVLRDAAYEGCGHSSQPVFLLHFAEFLQYEEFSAYVSMEPGSLYCLPNSNQAEWVRKEMMSQCANNLFI